MALQAEGLFMPALKLQRQIYVKRKLIFSEGVQILAKKNQVQMAVIVQF